MDIPIFLALVTVGNKSFRSPPLNYSKGNGIDRATFHHVLEVSTNEHALAQQHIIEMQEVNDIKQDLKQINPLILASTGLDVHMDSIDFGAKRKCIDNIDHDSWHVPKINVWFPRKLRAELDFMT